MKLEIQEILNSINTDINLLNNIDKKELLSSALFMSLYDSLHECEMTAKLTKTKDEFYSINSLYIATLSIYLEILTETKKELIVKTYNLSEEDKKYVFEQRNIFIAFIAKLFRTCRNITDIKEYNNLLLVNMWVSHIQKLYKDKI